MRGHWLVRATVVGWKEVVISAREGRHEVEGERIAMVEGRVKVTMGLREPDLSFWYLKPFYFFSARVPSTLVVEGRLTSLKFIRFI